MKTRALLVLAIIFSASFMGRFAVLASEIGAGEPSVDSAPKEEDSTKFTCVDGALAATVKDRIVALDKRELDLANRRSELKTYEKQIADRLDELEEANAKLKVNVDTHQSARDNDITKLAAIYEGMKPTEAAGIINEMDPEFAAGLLASMNSAQAAQIVAVLDTKRAYLISVILANRTQSP